MKMLIVLPMKYDQVQINGERNNARLFSKISKQREAVKTKFCVSFTHLTYFGCFHAGGVHFDIDFQLTCHRIRMSFLFTSCGLRLLYLALHRM